MIDPYTNSETNSNSVNYERSLRRLARSIAMSQGQFSLILACCNSLPLREQLVTRLHELSPIEIQELILHPSVNKLFTTIQVALAEEQPPALMVFGLESVITLDQLLKATNLVREEFRKQFAFPLILWVNDDILQKLTRIAPDFRSWGANSIRFDLSNPQPIDLRINSA